MELVKAAILFLVGVGAAAAFYISGWDHSLPHWLHLSREGGPIHLAIAPGATSGSPECPPGYAIDNRTGRAVLFTVGDVYPGYAGAPPAGPDWHPNDDGDRAYSQHTAFETPGPGEYGGPAYPDSSEPGVSPPDDINSGASNYGGSSPDYSDPGYGRSDAEDQTATHDDYGYGERGGYSDQPPPAYAQNPPGDAYSAPPSASQPIPLTPQYGSPYESQEQPVTPAPPPSSFGPPSQTSYGPPETRVRPGEVVFASSGNPSPRCSGSTGSVTLQLSE